MRDTLNRGPGTSRPYDEARTEDELDAIMGKPTAEPRVAKFRSRERGRRDVVPIIPAAPPPPLYNGPPASLPEAVTVFRKWLHLPDAMPLYAVLGAIAANELPGDPVWLGIVAPPSSAKTEMWSVQGAADKRAESR